MEDIFKKAFLEGYSSIEINVRTVLIAISVAFAIGIYIFIVYKCLTRKTFYSRSFNMSLVGVAMITSAIIITIQSSIVVSLGMVGALSIVRFRTAIKNPLDLMFLFWAISVGIICGAGYSIYALSLSALLTIAMVVLSFAPTNRAPMILVVNSSNIESEEALVDVIKKHAKHVTVKSRNIMIDRLDLTIELRTNEAPELVRKIIKCEGVISANLLQHNGEVTY